MSQHSERQDLIPVCGPRNTCWVHRAHKVVKGRARRRPAPRGPAQMIKCPCGCFLAIRIKDAIHICEPCNPGSSVSVSDSLEETT